MSQSVVPLRKPPVARGGGSNLARRVTRLETEVNEMNSAISQMKTDTAKIAADTTEILSVFSVSKDIYFYARKYGVRAITFGAGVMSAAGIGNPEVWKFIAHFFA